MSAPKKHRAFCNGREIHTDAETFEALKRMVPVRAGSANPLGSAAIYDGMTIYIRTEEELDRMEREIEAQQGLTA